jgi:hypothetical protein
MKAEKKSFGLKNPDSLNEKNISNILNTLMKPQNVKIETPSGSYCEIEPQTDEELKLFTLTHISHKRL